MKPIYFAPILLAALSGVAHSAGYISDLSGSSSGDPLVPNFPNPGVDGWTQSEANNDNIQPKAWIGTVGTNAGIVLGAYYDDLGNDPFYINQGVSLGLSDSSLGLTVALINSTLDFPERNDFFIGLLDTSGNNLATINFLANPPLSTDPLVEPSWNIAINTNPAFLAVFDNALYNVLFSFTANGADVDYNITISDNLATPNVFSSNGSITGVSSETIGNLRLGVSQGSTAYGDNHMGVTGINLVPEPTTALLAAFGAFGLLIRRRRAG